MKADAKVKFDYEEESETFTNFEELRARVAVMQEVLDEHAEILRQNDLVKTTEEDAPYVDEDEVYKRLK